MSKYFAQKTAGIIPRRFSEYFPSAKGGCGRKKKNRTVCGSFPIRSYTRSTLSLLRHLVQT